MISNTQKRGIIIIIGLSVSTLIWQINASWGNTFWTCLILSTTTFLLIYTPFEIYWSVRDIWFDRWVPLSLDKLEILKIKILVDDGYLQANIIISKDEELVKSRNTIIIISHGFSDTKETHQYLNYPLAYQGYVILAYDARGIGESKETGKRSQFLERIRDYNKILDWITNNSQYNKMKIYTIGFSIGAMTVLCAGFPNKRIEKIVAISSIANYQDYTPSLNPIVKFSYKMKGVNLNPSREDNFKLSPCLIIKRIKNNLSEDEWKRFSQKVLLIHSKNDKIIGFKNFEKIVQILNLPKENQLILEKGGHTHKKNELTIVGTTLQFLKD